MGRLLKGRAKGGLGRVRVAQAKPLAEVLALPEPAGAAARALREALIDALQTGDAKTARDLLLRCAWELDAAEQVLAGWLPALVAIDALADRGQPIDEDRRLRDYIANTLRAQIGRAVPCSEPLWVVPATPGEAAAACLLAIVSSQRGRPARPWLWERRPLGRPYVTIGRIEPAQGRGSDCLGHYGLVASESGLGIAAMLADTGSHARAKAINERARRWRRDWTSPAER